MKSPKTYTNRYTAILVLLALVMSGCAAKHIEKSYWSSSGHSLPTYSGNDTDTGIRWTVANDSTYLYFSFETHNRMVERMVMFRGVTLYLDPTGKRKKDIYLKYPYRSEADRPGTDSRTMNEPGDSFRSPATAYWMHKKDGMLINIAMERTRFNYHLRIDSLGFMDYYARIPLKRITEAGYPGINNLSVGIVVSQPEGNSGFGKNFRAHAGFRGGDEGGERGEVGESGEGDRPRGDMGERGRFQPVNINIWFVTALARPTE